MFIPKDLELKPFDLSGLGDFYIREFEDKNFTKIEQRTKILKFFESNLPDTRYLKFFSFPLFWKFEREFINMALSKGLKCSLVGVERESKVLWPSAYRMPGYPLKAFTKIFGKRPSIDGYCTDISYLFNCTASMLMSINGNDFDDLSSFMKWYTEFFNWNVIWFDFMSPIHREVLECLRLVPYCINRSLARIPIAITLQMSREVPEITTLLNKVLDNVAGLTYIGDKRVSEKFLKRFCRAKVVADALESNSYSFEDMNFWSYNSKDNVAMLNITGVLTKKD